jgi:hypothetical protein
LIQDRPAEILSNPEATSADIWDQDCDFVFQSSLIGAELFQEPNPVDF